MSASVTDQALIERYIEVADGAARPGEARLRDYGTSVWALIGDLSGAFGGDVRRLAEAHDLPLEAVHAALAYYRCHQALIDARLHLNQRLVS